MPRSVDELASLPGVGPYTAGAVACFAWESDVAFMDVNIRRVLQRFVFGPEQSPNLASNRELAAIAASSVPAGRGYAWNQALMELGATICRARTAACDACPLEACCCARPTIQAAVPTQPPKRRRPKLRSASKD